MPPDFQAEYSPNIHRNPLHYFGTWTPGGWKSHLIVRGETATEDIKLSGDGRSTCFAGLPSDFVEAVHDEADGATDSGIYPSVPRVEYPPGIPRWSVSHTFLGYPVADQTLYEQEYTWEREGGRLQTHFRRHIDLEEVRTDRDDGLTVEVRNPAISTVVAGNRSYPLCNSAVRGVWDNPEKRGRNYYLRQQVRRCTSHNGVYVLVAQSPVIQCLGIWKWEEGDERAFDSHGECRDAALLRQRGVPLDCPKLGTVGYKIRSEPSAFYGKAVEVVDGDRVRVETKSLDALQACRGVPFQPQQVGFAKWRHWDHARHIWGVPGHYATAWDLNDNGIVDGEDEETLRASLGREVRVNYYSAGYFGNDWLSAGILLNPEMQGEPVICAWWQGAGYDAAIGTVRLFETPGRDRKVYIEYHHDEPAAVGHGNILVSVRRLARPIL